MPFASLYNYGTERQGDYKNNVRPTLLWNVQKLTTNLQIASGTCTLQLNKKLKQACCDGRLEYGMKNYYETISYV